MEVIKKINNNVALCVDGNGNELIAFGKGIGFPQMPYELNDMSIVDRTFYSVNMDHLPMFLEADEEVLQIVREIIDYARSHVHHDINDTLYSVLVDHISFVVKRYREKVYVPLVYNFDFRYLYDDEANVGEWAVRFINERLKICLPEIEGTIIAMHIIECEEHSPEAISAKNDFLIKGISEIVEANFKFKLNHDGFNYSRFATHLQYLFQRQGISKAINSDNSQMFKDMCSKFPEVYACVEEINSFLRINTGKGIDEEEKLYLMLHVNRLCSREDCNQ